MITKTDFLEKVIFDTKYDEVKHFADALAHLCYKDPKLSKKVIKNILKAVSYSSNDQVQRHLVFIERLSLLNDDYQLLRLEQMFGFPFLMHNIKPPQEP